ncbi:MAG: TolC family protein [Pseudomonadota bacterium]
MTSTILTRRVRFVARAVLAVLVAALARAVAAEPVWTFDRVLESALLSHPAIQNRRAAQAAARAEHDGAQWQRFPSVSVETAAANGGANSGVVRIEQPLWTGGRISAAIDAASSRVDASGAALEEERLVIALRVIAAYTEAMRQQGRQKYARAGVAEHQKLLSLIRRRVDREVSTLTDQSLAESRMLQALNEESTATEGLSNALARLTQLAGAPVAETYPLEMPSAPGSMADAVSQALFHSPVLRRLGHDEATAEAEIAQRRSAYKPQLSVRLERNVGTQFIDGRPNETRAMLVLQAQPGAGLSAMSAVNASTARREAVRLAREAAARDIGERVTLDWNEALAARQRLVNASLSRDMSSAVFDSYTRQYVIGRKTWNDVLNAVREATQSQFALEDTRAQAVAATLRLRAQSGTLTPFQQSPPAPVP